MSSAEREIRTSGVPQTNSGLLTMMSIVRELHQQGKLPGVEGVAVSLDLNERLRRELRDQTSEYKADLETPPGNRFFGIPIHVCPALKGNQWMLMIKPDLRNTKL